MAQINGATHPELVNPAASGANDLNAPSIPAAMALPVDTGTSSASGDSSTTRKFYTLTASLREIYDDNVSATEHKVSSYETSISPSILVSFPKEDSNFSARYTLNGTYYSTPPGFNRSDFQTTHEFIAQYSHSFTDRFNLNLAEQFRYYYEPSLMESVGTAYQNGAYIYNSINATFTAQWTPLVGTTTSFANNIVSYENSQVAEFQNSVENTGNQSVSFAILPKINLNFGGIIDDIQYKTDTRGYTTYTLFAGAQWTPLPSLNFSAQGGGSYSMIANNSTLISPYAAASVSWQLGKRSSLSFAYTHEVAPTDQIGASAETVDRFVGTFNYDITSSLSAHLQGVYTNQAISEQLEIQGLTVSENEKLYTVDTGLTYHYNSYLDLEGGITASGVDSQLTFNKYDREQAYVGVRGTY